MKPSLSFSVRKSGHLYDACSTSDAAAITGGVALTGLSKSDAVDIVGKLRSRGHSVTAPEEIEQCISSSLALSNSRRGVVPADSLLEDR